MKISVPQPRTANSDPRQHGPLSKEPRSGGRGGFSRSRSAPADARELDHEFGGQETTAIGADLKATNPKTAAPLVSGKPVDKPIIREWSPQREIRAPGLGHPLMADRRSRWTNFAEARA